MGQRSLGLVPVRLWASFAALMLATAAPVVLAAGAATLTPNASDSGEVQRLARWVQSRYDNKGGPFAVIDKKAAQLHVFGSDGVLRASTPVLLGLARGDHSVAGIGDRKISEIKPEERTTPAGRFVSEPGRNLQGEDIVWIDYDAAISMHRVRAHKKSERRLERLASSSAKDNRISYGCVNVPVAFYDEFIKPTFGGSRAMVYVLPENQAFESVFDISKDAR